MFCKMAFKYDLKECFEPHCAQLLVFNAKGISTTEILGPRRLSLALLRLIDQMISYPGWKLF